MQRKECIAMVLAGGKGARLGALTSRVAKPVVYFGGKYRIIDFTLSNCAHSGIESMGVLTQYKPLALHDYISDGQTWNLNLNKADCGTYMLPSSRCGGLYSGTANAVYRNIDFIEKFDPEHVLVLSGDHIYKMDYRKMLEFHKRADADVTVSAITVPMEEASRFGIISASRDGKITKFVEKPENPKSNLASMGVYVFKWSKLKDYLIKDQNNNLSEHDFGKNIIPAVLAANEKMYAYKFDGYWRDVGTVHSLWEANMDLIRDVPPIDLYDDNWRIYTRMQYHAPCYLSSGAEVKNSIVGEGCYVQGKLTNSILFGSVTVEEGAEVIDSIIMPGASIAKGARVHRAILGNDVAVGTNAEIGADDGISDFMDNRICSKGISLIGPGICVKKDTVIRKNSHVYDGLLLAKNAHMTESKKVVNLKLVYA